jgi:peptidoglycan/xylan/chitin deacetylase (PgdA/CDA1 family)
MSWFSRSGLRVLMYHRVDVSVADALTVTTGQLEQQTAWLAGEGFSFVSLRAVLQALKNGDALPPAPVLVTFDDGYVDTGELARPVLKRFGVPGTVFVPTAFIGKASSWDQNARPLMNAAQLHSLVADGWDIGLHSHAHENYRSLSPEKVGADVRAACAAFAGIGLTPAPALAYPYDGRSRSADVRRAMHGALERAGVQAAFRIGNRINRMPVTNAFEIQRLGPLGDASFAAFKRLVWWGRWI